MAGADDYDEFVAYASLPPETDAEVRGLTELAAEGPVLELGVGTGRVAIPLAATGLDVHGIELDPAMAEQLRRKPGAERVQLHIGDMADVAVEGEFTLVYAVFGTLFALPSQDAQVRCFANVARRLAPEGRFLVEALVPQPGSYEQRRKLTVADARDDRVILSASETDPVAQTVDVRQVVLGTDGIEIRPVHIRYSWPSELDLMARLSGLRLIARWSGWDRAPLGADDQRHISVYGHDHT